MGLRGLIRRASRLHVRGEVIWFRVADLVNGFRMGHSGLHRRLKNILREQKRHWKGAYVQGYFYQGLEDIGIYGAKPTGHRFRQYDVDDLLKDADVLDIGSNSGFVAIYCAKLAKRVVGVELNPYLNRIADETAAYLGVRNTEFVDADFASYTGEGPFDVVLSLSNHHTIDGNLDMGFERHVARIAELLRSDGVMLFESHNVFGPGMGGVGDDGDMERKMEIITMHFRVVRYRMVRRFMKHGDIDKLFIVAQKSDEPAPMAFDLNEARQNYEWTWT